MAGADDTASCSVRPDCGVLDTVARIGSRLATEEGSEAAAVESSLRELQGVHMTFEALEATKIGRAVNALRKSAPSEEARQVAAALYKAWKAPADERFRTQQQKQPKGIEKPSSSSSSLPPAVDAKQSSGSDGDRKTVAPASAVEATPGTSRHEEHEHDSAAVVVRKPRSVRVMTVSAPGKTQAEQRRVTAVRRAAAASQPAAASSTRRNGSSQGLNVAKQPPPPTALPKPPPVGSSGARKRKAEAPACFDEARLERAKKRLLEGYNEAAAAKEKRTTKEVKVIAVQRKALADEPFRMNGTQQRRPKGIGKPSSSSSSPPPVDANRKTAAPASAVEATPEATPEANRHVGHGSAAVVRKPTTVRVMTISTPGKEEQRRRCVTAVRRTAAAQEPAPASNTKRNGSNNHNQPAYCPATASQQGRPNVAKRVTPTGAASSTTAKPPPTALTKPPPAGSSGACKRKAEAPTCFDQAARLERAKKRLHEGYKEAAAAKEKRKIMEIKVTAGQGKARQPPSQRCTAAGGTRKQAPVTCRPRMSRAS